HVDVDDAGAALRVEGGRLGHHGGVGAGDLHRDGSDFAVVVEAAGGLDAVPELGVAGGHLGHGVTGAQALAELPEGAVGDAGHGGDEHVVREGPGADLHDWSEFNQLGGEGLLVWFVVRVLKPPATGLRNCAGQPRRLKKTQTTEPTGSVTLAENAEPRASVPMRRGPAPA